MRSIAFGVADASTLELVEAAEAIARELAGRDAPEAGHAALENAETLGKVIDLLEAALAPAVRRVDDTGVFAEFGFSSTGAWLRTRLGMRDGRAAERLRLARQLPHLREVAKRFVGGDLSYGFAAAVSDAVTRLDREDVEPAEQILLGLVDAGHTAGQLAKDAARITDLINEHRGKGKEPDDSKRGFSRSWLTKSRSLDGGSWLKGWLSPEHTAIFEQILGPLAKPKAKGDDRDLGQRTADALMALLSQGHKGAGVTVIIDLKAFIDATGDPGPFTARPGPASDQHGDDAAAEPHPAHRPGEAPDGEPGGEPDDPEDGPGDEAAEDDAAHHGSRGVHDPPRDFAPPRPAARLLDGTPISPQRARQIALNAGINVLLLGESHLPLRLGRTVRFVTPAQRKALLALYETCCVTGCQIPAHLCEIHHTDGGWKLGTPTDIDKLVPTCGWHNRWVETHSDQVEQRKDDLGRTVLRIRPPWNTRRSATG